VKGILDIEFILSVVVFLGAVAFAIFMIALNVIPTVHIYSETEDMRSRVYQISEILLFSEGNPKNWDETNVNSIGLSSSEYYILDAKKIFNLSNLCRYNYQRVRELLGMEYSMDIMINMSYSDGTSLSLCRQRFTKVRPEYAISRLAVLNDSGSLSVVKIGVSLIK
jgi:hypothetical protein